MGIKKGGKLVICSLGVFIAFFCISVQAGCLRIAYPDHVDSGLNQPLVEKTISHLKKRFGEENVSAERLSEKELKERILGREVDLLISPSAFYRQMIREGLKDLATAVSLKASDPDQSEGSVILVKGDDFSLYSLKDLKRKRLGYSREFGLSSILPALGEIAKYVQEEWDFQKGDKSLSASTSELLDALKNGEIDAAVLPTCYMEWFVGKNEYDTSWLRVLAPRQYSTLACAHSTALYPNMTISSLPSLPSAMAREVTKALLEINPSETGLYWSIATNFQAMDKLLFSLDMDAWAQERKWSVSKVLKEYWGLFFCLALILLSLAFHSTILAFLVKRRTRQLSSALSVQKQLRQDAASAARHIERLQKMGAIGHLSTLLTHELAQPLGNLGCYLFSLKRKLKKKGIEDAEIDKTLDALTRQSDRAQGILEKVREFAKAKGPGVGECDFPEVIAKALEQFLASVHFRGEIAKNLKEGVAVRFDPLELELVVINLLRNSAEAQETVSHPKIYLSLEEDEFNAELRIWDKGPELSQEKISAINTQDTTRKEGLGLGLSIVRSLVERHGGRLKFERSKHKGLLVKVIIPKV